jgi:DNA repair protein RadC
VVIAHNHPGGVALPSYADVVQTRRIAQILKEFSANLIDHIIVTEEDYVSMAQSSEFKDIFQV